MTRTRVVGVEGEVRDEDHGEDGGDDGRAVDLHVASLSISGTNDAKKISTEMMVFS